MGPCPGIFLGRHFFQTGLFRSEAFFFVLKECGEIEEMTVGKVCTLKHFVHTILDHRNNALDSRLELVSETVVLLAPNVRQKRLNIVQVLDINSKQNFHTNCAKIRVEAAYGSLGSPVASTHCARQIVFFGNVFAEITMAGHHSRRSDRTLNDQ